MGDQNTLLTTAEVRHLLRRAGLGPTPKEVDQLAGLTRGQAADELLSRPSKRFRPGGRDFNKSHDKWLKFMVKGKRPLQSRMALFWHDHFSVNFSTVQDVDQMAEYVRLLHLAATTRERDVEATLRALLDHRRPFDYASVQAVVTPAIPQIPALHLPAPDLARYDALLVGGARC